MGARADLVVCPGGAQALETDSGPSDRAFRSPGRPRGDWRGGAGLRAGVRLRCSLGPGCGAPAGTKGVSAPRLLSHTEGALRSGCGVLSTGGHGTPPPSLPALRGGCDGGLAHRWADLTVPQWPTEEAHPAAWPARPLCLGHLLSASVLVPRLTPASHTLTHGPRPQGRGGRAWSLQPQARSGREGHTFPRSAPPARFAQPRRAHCWPGLDWPPGLRHFPLVPQRPALLLASSRQASPCSRQPRAPPRWPSPWRGAKPSACGWRGALPGGPRPS